MTRGLHGSGVGGYTLRDSRDDYFRAYYIKHRERIKARLINDKLRKEKNELYNKIHNITLNR